MSSKIKFAVDFASLVKEATTGRKTKDLLKTFDRNLLPENYKIFEFKDGNNFVWYQLKKKNIFGIYTWVWGLFDMNYAEYGPIRFDSVDSCLSYVKRKKEKLQSKKITSKEITVKTYQFEEH